MSYHFPDSLIDNQLSSAGVLSLCHYLSVLRLLSSNGAVCYGFVHRHPENGGL